MQSLHSKILGALRQVGPQLVLQIPGLQGGPGAADGAVVVFLDFAAFFFAALAVVGAADTVGAALTVGWFVGLLVLDPFFVFCTRRSSIIISRPTRSCAISDEAVHAKGDSPKASSEVDDISRTLIVVVDQGGV